MSKKTNVNQEEINRVAWAACDTFRGVVDPSEYKNYILVMLFLKYVSDTWKEHREKYSRQYKGDKRMVERRMQRERFVLPPGSDFDTLYEKRGEANIGELINIALEDIEEANKTKLDGVFRNIDFNSESNLGETKDRNRRLKHLLDDFAKPELDLRPARVGGEDIIGNTYMYLIERFAAGAGKKGGEFYTPPEVSGLLARLLDPQPGAKICDPACGSGSLLIHTGLQVGAKNFALHGQESNGSTWALCRMNMFLHGMDSARIEWGDTFHNPKLVEGNALKKFDIVVANPPFSLDKWGADEAEGDRFQRFHRGIPPKSKGDYAFISHMIETTVAGTGKVGVIVPHGVLFRGGAEGRIRKSLIEENLLEGVIGLPANLFYGTGIPAAILVLNRGKKPRKQGTDILFIDASREFAKDTNQNRLREEDLNRIAKAFRAFKTVDKYAHRATQDEVRENDFNLNIPRYVDTFKEEEPVDIAAAQKEIDEFEGELTAVRREMAGYLAELGIVN